MQPLRPTLLLSEVILYIVMISVATWRRHASTKVISLYTNQKVLRYVGLETICQCTEYFRYKHRQLTDTHIDTKYHMIT